MSIGLHSLGHDADCKGMHVCIRVRLVGVRKWAQRAAEPFEGQPPGSAVCFVMPCVLALLWSNGGTRMFFSVDGTAGKPWLAGWLVD